MKRTPLVSILTIILLLFAAPALLAQRGGITTTSAGVNLSGGSTIAGPTTTTTLLTVKSTDNGTTLPLLSVVDSTGGTIMKAQYPGTVNPRFWTGPEGAGYNAAFSWLYTNGAMNWIASLNNGANFWNTLTVYNEDNGTSAQDGIYAQLADTHTAGTKTGESVAVAAWAERSATGGAGGTIAALTAVQARVDNNSAGTVTAAYGVHVPTGNNAGTLTTLYGIKVENQTSGATNYALATGTGIFSIGDARTTITPQAMTAGTMTYANSAEVRQVTHRFNWTNAMVTALGAVLAGDVTICTLPAKTIVKNVYVVIDTPDTSANALTIAVGRVSATYIDYIVASDAKAAANTVYGDASAERGTNLTGYDLPSVTGTTAVVAHFIKTTTNLSTVTGSTGHIYVTTEIVP